MLPSLATDSAETVFPSIWKPLFLRFLSRDGIPFPGLSSSGVRRAQWPRLVTFSAAAAQLSGWTAGAPREADGDCPAPPEVLAKKPACS